MGILVNHILKVRASDGTMDYLYAKCIELGVTFQDDLFPHDKSSLIDDWSDPSLQPMIQKDKWHEITWKKAVDLPTLNKDGKLAIFYEGIDPADVRQGILGDCWFLSAVSALAEKPERIKKLFMNDHLEPNEVGIYGVRVCKNGEWIDIVVDDWIPVRNDMPVFSKANGHELWVILLEKAWAKLHGTY